LFAGKPKLGKSWLALGLGIATSTGGVALGTKLVEQGECLYLALEDNRRRLQKRLRKLLKDGSALERLHIATDWPRLGEGGVEALEAWLGGVPRHPARGYRHPGTVQAARFWQA
jgi:AAA domain